MWKCFACVVLFAVAASAAMVTVQYTEQFNAGSSNCGSFNSCPQILVTVPQWDPAQGALKEIDWSFEDTQFWYGGINDMYQPVGIPWSATFTDGASSPDLGMNTTSNSIYSGLTTGSRQISMGGWFGQGGLNASGSITDLNSWIGTGNKTIVVQPYAATHVTEGFPYVFAGIASVHDVGLIAISYVDDPSPSPVPEPRWMAMLALGLLGLRKRQRTALCG